MSLQCWGPEKDWRSGPKYSKVSQSGKLQRSFESFFKKDFQKHSKRILWKSYGKLSKSLRCRLAAVGALKEKLHGAFHKPCVSPELPTLLCVVEISDHDFLEISLNSWLENPKEDSPASNWQETFCRLPTWQSSLNQQRTKQRLTDYLLS